MDLHFTNDEPTETERQAIDSFVESLPSSDSSRQYLLPVLHQVQSAAGWISPGALNHICKRLEVPPAEAFGVADFYALFSTRPEPPKVVHICDDIACRIKGAEKLCAGLEHLPSDTVWHPSPCLGLCERAPAAMVVKTGAEASMAVLAPATAEETLEALNGVPVLQAGASLSVPQAGQKGLKLLARIGQIDPESLDDYIESGGFQALRRAIELGPEAVVREVVDSKLVGRGGAAFPTGVKWNAVRSGPPPRLLVCNADESEPGTFKDRVLMEGDPFALVESMIVAAFATGCERGYLYVRGEYPLAAARLENAIQVCRERGYLGSDVLGAGVRFDIELRLGAGAYICGEETALFNSIEGRRGEPRNKPPYPTQAGLFARPTAVNNVETLMNVPHVLLEGGKAFASIGTERSTGTKLFCVSGHVARPGVYEAEFGITLGKLLELAGG